MPNTIEGLKQTALDTIGYFLLELKEANTKFEIESVLYAISRISTDMHGEAHSLNCGMPRIKKNPESGVASNE